MDYRQKAAAAGRSGSSTERLITMSQDPGQHAAERAGAERERGAHLEAGGQESPAPGREGLP